MAGSTIHQERWQKDRRRCDCGSGRPGAFVYDECCEHQDRTGRELAECQTVNELPRRQPAELIDHLLLNEGKHRESAAEGEGANFEEEYSERPQIRRPRTRSWCRDEHGGGPFRQQEIASVVETGESDESGERNQTYTARIEEGNSGAACGKERENEADRRQEHHCGGCECDRDLRPLLNCRLSESIDRHRKDADNNWADPIERVSCRWQRTEHHIHGR